MNKIAMSETQKSAEFKSGFVSLVGRPNVGKSTLMNHLVGEKIAIVSNRPQTTRNKIRSILTGEDYQIVFIDTPGLHKPRTKLGDYMVKSAQNALGGVDVVLYLVEPTPKVTPGDEDILAMLPKDAKVMLVINKADTVKKPEILLTIDAYAERFPFCEIVPISALAGDNTDALLATVRQHLSLGPMYFPDDMVTDQPERQIAAEMIREKALSFLQEEIPHGIAVEITLMKKRPKADMVDVEATIYCERESHKGIVIGKAGAMLKKIGASARHDMQKLLGSPINLQLWVKVRKRWRDNDFILRDLGYDPKKI
ncbi:MAG: GTPase Era [Defluviitaleaceae bacterium]|nr:GTPase Era [Defluviitaleaceae bacterium]